MTTTVAIKHRVGSPIVWLEVTYQGLDAPTDFFADLQLIGWRSPTIAPPPHDAIDWSRPNEATGERFTLRDYTVAGAVVQPPAGTGSRGIWTEVERATNVAALARVLDRHTTIEIDDPAGLVRPLASLPPPPTPVAAPTTSADPAPDRADADLQPVGLARVVAVADPLCATSIDEVISALGLTDATITETTRTELLRYRGKQTERQITAIQVEIHVPEPHARLVLAHLAAATHLRPDSDRLWVDLPPQSSELPGALEAEADGATSVDVAPTRSTRRFGPGALSTRKVPTFITPAH